MGRGGGLEKLVGGTFPVGAEERRDDPAKWALKRELRARLDAAMPELDASMRQLWDELEMGHSIRASAAALGLSYYQARRLCKRMFDLLRNRLTGGAEETRQ